MTLDPGLLDALVPLIFLQTGALIFFAGSVAFTLRSHGDRLDKTEATQVQLIKGVSQLAGKEGIQL